MCIYKFRCSLFFFFAIQIPKDSKNGTEKFAILNETVTVPQSHLSAIIIDCSLMSYIDSMGVTSLKQVRFLLSNCTRLMGTGLLFSHSAEPLQATCSPWVWKGRRYD